MKPRLRLKWLQIQPRPDLTHGLPHPRSSHAVSFLKQRQALLVLGGEYKVAHRPVSLQQHAWLCALDARPSARGAAWHRLDFALTNEHIPVPRIGHAQAVYADRYVYLFGGRTGPPGTERNDLLLLDTHDWVWQRVRVNEGRSDAAPHPRAQATMWCVDHALYLFGGTNARGPLTDLHRFDVHRRTWRHLGRPLQIPQAATMMPIDGGKKLAVYSSSSNNGGQVYDIEREQWDVVEHWRAARCGGVTAILPRSGVAVGFGGASDVAEYSNDIMLWEEATGNFMTQVPAPKPPKKKKPEEEEEEDPLDASDETVPKATPWPEARAWSAMDGQEDAQGMGHWFLFGGMGGGTQRLQDMWKLEVHKVGS